MIKLIYLTINFKENVIQKKIKFEPSKENN